jgi:hypothetical protein
MIETLVARAKGLLLSPKTEWDAIDAESADTQKLIVNYVAPLAAIPALAMLIGMGLLGPVSIGAAFGMALMNFVLAIVGVFVIAFIIDALAPSFGAAKNDRQALKIAAYFPTAAWAAGVFMIIPFLGALALVGAIYSLYLLFIGLPILMRPPAEKATNYTIATIVAAIVVMAVVSAAASVFMPRILFGPY